jgi:hypothetical protein
MSSGADGGEGRGEWVMSGSGSGRGGWRAEREWALALRPKLSRLAQSAAWQHICGHGVPRRGQDFSVDDGVINQADQRLVCSEACVSQNNCAPCFSHVRAEELHTLSTGSHRCELAEYAVDACLKV